MVWDIHPAVGAGLGDRVTQDKVKKKSKQVMKQACDQNPEDCPHIATPGIRKHEPETQKPGSEHDADHEGSAAIHGHCVQHCAPAGGLVCHNQPDKRCAAHKDPGAKLNCLRNYV
jgi:hypothetical protein